MSVQLLDKTRKINKLFAQQSVPVKLYLMISVEVLMDTLSSNILVLSKKGKVLGIGFMSGS